MNCPVTCGRPTRMSAEAFARMCAARRDYAGGRCAACGGWPESWPKELTIIEGGTAMAVTKQSTRIIAEKDEELAALKAEIVERDRKIEGLLTVVGNWEKKSGQYNERIAELEAELAAFRSASSFPAAWRCRSTRPGHEGGAHPRAPRRVQRPAGFRAARRSRYCPGPGATRVSEPPCLATF